MHAAYLLQMLDTALSMLGPDIELLSDILAPDLGHKHLRYGVTPEMFHLMGDALLYILKETLGDGFTESIKASWVETYVALSQDMIRAQHKVKK